jgi:hypothetical protein
MKFTALGAPIIDRHFKAYRKKRKEERTGGR